MIEIEITAIRKDNGNHENPYEAVEAYKWVQHGAKNGGIASRSKVVGWLESGVDSAKVSAYVHRVSPRAYCYVNESSRGTKFLQTHGDATDQNNLLKLPPC